MNPSERAMPFASTLQQASRVLARATHRRWLRLDGGRPVLSMTFDDAIASACVAGAQVLASHGVRGTYYVAGSLTDGIEDGHPAHGIEHLRTLHAAGHEIGCHGWAHRRYTGRCAADLRDDLQRNAEFVRRVTGQAPRNFAYPFGAYGYLTKRVCAPRFESCRVLGGGMHRGRVDLGNLGCWRLYGPTRAPEAWRPALETLAAGGWAVFNTHAVDPACGSYGCTPEDLDALVRHALSMGALVLPVSEAIGYWRAAASAAG